MVPADLFFFFFSQRLNLYISFYILHRFSFKIIEFDFHPTLVAPEQFSGEGPINASVLIWFLISSRTRQNWKQRSVLTSWRKGQQGWTLPWWHTVTTWLTTPVLRSVELDNNRRTLRWMSFVSNGFSGFLIFQISAEILPLKKNKIIITSIPPHPTHTQTHLTRSISLFMYLVLSHFSSSAMSRVCGMASTELMLGSSIDVF